MKKIILLGCGLLAVVMLFSCAAEGMPPANSNSSSSSLPASSYVSSSVSQEDSFAISLLDPNSSNTSSNDHTSSEESDADTSSETSGGTQDPDDTPHMVNGFLVVGNRGMELFGGSASAGAETAKLMNQFKERVGSNVNVYAMPIPLASSFYAPDAYRSARERTAECFSGLRDALLNVSYVDAFGALSAHTQEDIYARTDHHWFACGAYYAAEALCKQANTTFTPLSQFTQQSFDGFLGSVYSSYHVSELKQYPETFVWYEPTQSYTAHYYTQNYQFSFSGSMFSKSSSYLKFIYGDGYAVRLETGVKNGRKLLVIKDSFGNALAPFLIAGFEEVYLIDFRDFSCNVLNFIQEHQITDVTFALSAFSVAGSKRNNITRLMNL